MQLGPQAAAYEACDRTRTPLHTPKASETCKKSTPCLIKKASRCAADRLKQQRFLSFTFYKTQRFYEKIMCIYLLFHWFSGENCIIFTFSLHKGR